MAKTGSTSEKCSNEGIPISHGGVGILAKGTPPVAAHGIQDSMWCNSRLPGTPRSQRAPLATNGQTISTTLPLVPPPKTCYSSLPQRQKRLKCLQCPNHFAPPRKEAFRHRCGAWSSKPMLGSDVLGRFDSCTLPPLLEKKGLMRISYLFHLGAYPNRG